MTHAAPNPEDRQQLDALASRLAELKPASASGSLQAQAFYRAGIQAARVDIQHRRESSRWLARAAVVGLIVGSSGLSYWAGASRSADTQMAITPSAAESDLQAGSPVAKSRIPDRQRVEPPGLPPESPNNDATNALASEQSIAPALSVDGTNAGSKPLAFGLPIAKWLKLHRVTPDEYLQLVEARTTPPPPSDTATDAPLQDRLTEESLLRELYGTPHPVPRPQWMPML